MLGRARDDRRRAELEEKLRCPPVPAALAYLWQAFTELSARRQVGFAMSPIMWSEIRAFNELSGLKLNPWEVSIILQLDDLFMTERSKKK